MKNITIPKRRDSLSVKLKSNDYNQFLSPISPFPPEISPESEKNLYCFSEDSKDSKECNSSVRIKGFKIQSNIIIQEDTKFFEFMGILTDKTSFKKIKYSNAEGQIVVIDNERRWKEFKELHHIDPENVVIFVF